MNKKILSIFVSLIVVAMLATPLVGTATAGKGNNKEYYKVTLTSFTIALTNVEFMPPAPHIPKRVQAEFTLTAIDYMLQIGSNFYTPDDYDYTASGTLKRTLGGDIALETVRETYTFDGLGTLEISINNKKYNYGTPEQYDDATVNGWGTDYFKDVKITAMGYGVKGDVKEHIGTIMGWPGLLAP